MFEIIFDLAGKYFCDPILGKTERGYNFVNTIFYILILFVVIFYLYKFLAKKQIKFDFGFVLAVFPFIVFGSSLRVLNDMGFFYKTCNPLDPNFYTFTPGIWFLTGGILFATIVLSGKNWKKFVPIVGSAITLPILAFEIINFVAWNQIALIIVAMIFILFILKVLSFSFLLKKILSDKMNLFVIFGQALDGFGTLVATSLNCTEQHPVSAFVISINPWLFILVKILIASLIVYYADREIEDENFRNFVKFWIIVLGFAPGLRNLLTIGVGTCI
ncbi:MAG: DUF63 family protein [Candidatus Diapherotrites archaeon]